MSNEYLLENSPFFAGGDDILKRSLMDHAVTASLKVGEYFYHQGDHCSHFALMKAGTMRVFRLNESGRQITLYHLHEGQTCLVNMICAFLNCPTPACALAESPVDAFIVPAVDFRSWVNTNEYVRKYVFETMSARVVEVMTLVEEIAFQRIDRRIAEYLMQHFLNWGSPVQELATTHEEIAAELGTAREVVSRVLKEFERVGAIDMARGRIELRDENLLRSHGSQS